MISFSLPLQFQFLFHSLLECNSLLLQNRILELIERREGLVKQNGPLIKVERLLALLDELKLQKEIAKAIVEVERKKEGHSLEKILKRVLLALFEKVPQDENVFYFLIKREKELEQIVGPKALRDVISKRFKIEGELNWIASRFLERGFTQLADFAKLKIEHLNANS